MHTHLKTLLGWPYILLCYYLLLVNITKFALTERWEDLLMHKGPSHGVSPAVRTVEKSVQVRQQSVSDVKVVPR